MVRLGRVGWAIIAGLLILGLAGCGGKSKKAPPSAASVTVAPTTASLEIGALLQFTGTSRSSSNAIVTVPLTWTSSNTSVLDVANNGLACAGKWDSLTIPIVCTPGAAGTALVTASASGVTSTPVTIMVHQHVDKVLIAPVTPPPSCLSQTETQVYQATAFSNGQDITSSIGSFSWAFAATKIVTLSTTATGLLAGQVQATAADPGLTQIFASVGGATSNALNFATCPVQSITLDVAGSGGTSFSVNKGSSKSITATVLDTRGVTLTNVPLTWSSSRPATASVNASGNVAGVQPGTSTIVASCTPPACNTNLVPLQPIYPTAAVTATITGTNTPGNALVTTTGCGTTAGCVTSLVAMPATGNAAGGAIGLPQTPNSLLFNRQGTKAYLGSSQGLMTFNPSSATAPLTLNRSVTGKVLAISPNGNHVIVSDTSSTPHQLFIFDDSNNSFVPLTLNGVTAAAFSPDNLKAFLVAGNTNTMYVYSALAPLKTILLSRAVNEVTFLANGNFAYFAGGPTSAVSGLDTVANCNNTVGPSVATSGSVSFFKSTPSGTRMVGLDSPGLDVVDVTLSGSGCVPGISQSATSVNLGQGSFIPRDLLLAPDGSKVYVLTGNLGSVPVHDLSSGATSALPITGNLAPVAGGITGDGTLIYLITGDGLVHRLDTVAGGDTVQIPAKYCSDTTLPCLPDLIAVRP
jgi:hypothetical protein